MALTDHDRHQLQALVTGEHPGMGTVSKLAAAALILDRSLVILQEQIDEIRKHVDGLTQRARLDREAGV